MPERRKKPESNLRIDIKQWATAIETELMVRNIVNNEQATQVLNTILDMIETNLLCKDCGRVLLDDNFYNQQAQFARRYKAQICKECWNRVYQPGKRN